MKTNIRHDLVNFAPASQGMVDPFNARFKNIRWDVLASKTIVVDASMETNLPGIAKKYLGDKYLFWAIMQFNGIVDPLREVKVGKVLRIPDLNDLERVLNQSTASELSNYQGSVVNI